MSKKSMKQIIYDCIYTILNREQKKYAKLSEIYEEVSRYLEVENDDALKSQIRGRLQEGCEQYPNSFMGEAMFLTEKVRSGCWTIKANEKKYIRYTHNSYLVSDDNWLTVEMVKSISDEYILDTDSDNNYRAKLIQMLGKEKASIILMELNHIRKLLKQMKGIEKPNDGYGTAFEVFAISSIYNVSYEECILKYIVHGDSDGSIDAIFCNYDSVDIYQIKLGEIKDNAYHEMQKNYFNCIKEMTPKDGKDLYNFIKENKEYHKNKKVHYRSISTNSLKEGNITPEEVYQMFFRNKLLPLSKNNLILNILKPTFENSSDDQLNVSTDGNNNFSFYMRADLLIHYLLEALGIYDDHYDKNTIDISKYFSDNVRGVLSANAKMIETIENEPENFVKYNNGINITGEVDDLGPSINIKNPVINNGQQTVTTLILVGKNLDRIMVPVKITNEVDIVIKGKISQYSNEQVKVKPIDMLSLNSYIRNIQEAIFHTPYHNETYYLKIYSSGKKTYYEIMQKLYKKNNIIELLDFIKLYFSVKNNKDLGLWKNSPSYQIENTSINDYLDKDLSFRVCEAISKASSYIENISNKKDKDDFKSADLAFKYLICKENMKEEDAAVIIHNINQKYYYKLQDEKSKLIDVYKSSTIINKIEDELSSFRKSKTHV